MGTGGLDIHQARFARHGELSGLLSREPATDGVLLGMSRYLLFFNRFVTVCPTSARSELGNVLVVAPTRGGKGLLAVSQLLSWKHSVIVNDIKGDLFTQTAGYRRTLGKVYVIDPQGFGHCYDPLDGKTTEDALYSAASQLLFKADEGEGAIFTQRAMGMLTCLFAAARIEQAAPFPYVRLLMRSGLRSAAARLNHVDPRLASEFLYADYHEANFENRFLLSSWETLKTRMIPIVTETVIRSLVHSDFDAEMIMRSDTPVTIYLRWKEQDLLALAPLVRLLWSSLINALITTYDTNQGRGCRPVLLLLDEAGRTAIPCLADQATTVAGRHICLAMSIQSLSQLEVIYGRSHAQVLKDNMETQIYYRPNDLATARHIQERLGKQSAYAHSATLKEGEETTQGLSEQGVPLMTSQEIMQLRDEEIICFHRRLPPLRMERMDWRNHPQLTQRRKMPAPKLADLPSLADIPVVQRQRWQGRGFSDGYLDPDKRREGKEREGDRLN